MTNSDTASLRDSLWHAEQVKLLYGSLVLALVFNVLLASLMVSVMGDAIKRDHALLWLGTLAATLLYRAGLFVRYRKFAQRVAPELWLKHYRIGVLCTGLVWGFAAFVLFPQDDMTNQVYLAFVLAGVSAGAITSLAADRFSAWGFFLLVLIPLVLSFMREGGAMPMSMALMVALFMLFLAVAAARMQRNFYNNVELRADLLAQDEALRESEKRFRYMLETCPTAARIARTEGHKVVFFNQRYVELINTTQDQVGEIDPRSYYANQADYEEIMLRLRRGEQVFEKLVELSIPGAGKKWALASYLPIQYAGESAVLGWFHDITERVNMEQMKSEFVSIVSHELRTPLTAIGGSLGLLAGGVLGPLPDKVQELIQLAQGNSQRLTYLINDLLDIEKLSAGKMSFDLQTVDVQPLILKAVEENRGYGKDREVSIKVQGQIPAVLVRLDTQRFMQILANLFSNAIKYSPQGAQVDVSAQVSQTLLTINVRDYGAGIPDEFRSRIFGKFAQADSSDSRMKGGTGLGLAITRELVQQMGGEIGFDSAPGQGANFYVRLPLASATG